MKPTETIRKRTKGWSADDFAHEFPSPVLVAESIIGGRLGRTSSQGRKISRALRPSTLVHIDPSTIQDPKDDDILVTRPLNRPMWVPLMKGPGTPREQPISIGRFADCDVVINDYTISKNHAFFAIDPILKHYRVLDSGSTNGTSVGDVELEHGQRAIIECGGQVTFGRLIFRFFTAQGFWRYLHVAPTATFDVIL